MLRLPPPALLPTLAHAEPVEPAVPAAHAAAQVDGVLLSHPQVAEAVSFAAPDEKYGEIVSSVMCYYCY